jgi:pyridoxal phosphate enzyme (YggS family)
MKDWKKSSEQEKIAVPSVRALIDFLSRKSYIWCPLDSTIAENVRYVRERIAAACGRNGKDPGNVRLVAVTKTFDAAKVREAVESGISDIGENFVQELLEKREEISNPAIQWHFVGHLQSNKVRFIADFVHLIHSVDRRSVAEEIDKRGAKIGRVVEALVEVNTTGEQTKFGVKPEETVEFIRSIAHLRNLKLKGLMTIGPFLPNPEDSRPAFRTLRALSDEVRKNDIENVEMTDLSMGMTHDFEVAIEEGATMIRLGTAIFGSRKKVGQ